MKRLCSFLVLVCGVHDCSRVEAAAQLQQQRTQELLHAPVPSPNEHTVPVSFVSTSHQYVVNAAIGEQNLTVLVDTATSFLWVPNAPCPKIPGSCYPCKEQLRVGDIVVQGQEYDNRDLLVFPFDGILGLGFPSEALGTSSSPLLNMAKQNLIDRPVFSLFLSDGPVNEITFGAINHDRFTGNLARLPVRQDSKLWTVDFDHFTFGQDHIKLDQDLGAVFDSGTADISLPTAIADLINKAIGNSSCDQRASLPDMTFTLSGNDFVLSSTDYLIDDAGECRSAIRGVDYPAPLGPLAIIGNRFLRRWYSVFDYQERTVMLAEAKGE